MKKRVVSLLLCLIMALSLIPTAAFATEASSQDDGISLTSIRPDDQRYYTYEFYNGSTLISTQIVKDGVTLLEPQVPAQDGKVFTGWYDETGKLFTSFGTVSGVTETKTIRVDARFKDGYHVTFLTTDGSVLCTATVTPNGTLTDLPDEVKNYQPAGKRVTAWKSDNGEFTTSTVVTGDITLTPECVDCYWVTFDTQGGTGVESQYVDLDNTLTLANVTAPTRTGYTFKGWSLTQDGTTVTSVTPTADTTLYAIWEASKVKYTVAYWGENANDNKFETFLGSEEKTAPTGTSVTASNLPSSIKNAAYFKYKDSDPATVKADGSTVINVRCTRNKYKVTFDLGSKSSNTMTVAGKKYTSGWNATKYTLTAKFEQNIEDLWPTASNFNSGSNFSGWTVSGLSYTATSKIVTMTANLCATDGKTAKANYEAYCLDHLYYMFESFDQTSPVNGNDRKFYNGKYYDKSDAYSQDANSEGGTWNPKSITGMTAKGTDTKVLQSSGGLFGSYATERNVFLYYDRLSYKLTWNNYGSTTTDTLKYGAQLANKGTPARPAGFSENATFKGWYTVPVAQITDTTVPFDFAGKTMPASNMTLFAYWVEAQIEVTFIVGNRSFKANIPYGTKANSADAYATAITAISTSGKTLLKWVNNTTGSAVDVNQQLYTETTLRAVFKGDTHKVTYVVTPGTGSVTDDRSYEYDALAVVKSGSDITLPAGKVFLGWTTVAGGTTVTKYPGSTVQMKDQDITLYAVYGDKASTVQLTYKANGGNGADITRTDIPNNSKVTLLGADTFTRPDYEFTGWNTQADGKGTSFAADASARVDNLGSDNVLYAQWVRQTGSLTIKKVVEGVTLDENKTFQFQLYTINDTKLVTYDTVEVTVKAGKTSGSTTVSVPTDMYFVQEIATSAAIDNYSVTTAYDRNGGSIPVLGDVDIDGTAAVVTESGNTTVKVTNTYEAQTADLTIVKKLNTALPQNMTFTFNVKEGTSATTTAEITIKAGDLEGSTTVKDLKIGTRYTVQEDTTSAQVIGYTLTAPGAQKVTINATGAQVEFVNHYAKDTTSVTVTKEWNDNLVKALRPESVTVQLMKNDVPVDGALVVPDDNNQWSHTWTDLPMYNDTGSKITYSVKEVNVPAGYTVAVNPVATAATPTFTITNTANVVEAPEIVPASLTVIKKDADNGALLKGAKFTLIHEGGKATDAAFAETDENGKAVFTDLAKGTYTLKEITAPAGYQATDKTWTITVSDDAKTAAYKLVAGKFVKTITCKVDDVENVVSNGTITITNAKNTGTLTINKTLNVALPKDMTFKFNVMKGTGEPVSATITIEAGKTSGTAIVENLTVGTTYTVQEVAESAQLDGYTVAIPKAQTVKISGVATKDTVSFTNTYTKTVTPAPEKYTFTIDITKNIELLKRTSRNPGKASFTFEAYMVDKQKNVTVLGDVTIETRGTKSASGKLTFTLTDEQLTDGATVYVREVEGNARGWTYDGAIYKLEIGHDGKIVTGDTGLTFTNVYYRKASSNTPTDDKTVKSVKTGDMGIAMYAMTSLLSLGGAALVIKKRKDEK